MKSILYFLYTTVCLSFFIIMTITTAITSLLSLMIDPSGKISFLSMKYWGRSVLWFARIKVTVSGLENIKSEKIQIFASNHTSQLDILVLSSIIPVKFGWVAKKELFKIPLFGWHLRANNYVAVDRDNKRKAVESFYKAAEQIKAGARITIFPEGTRSRNGELQPFKKGVFHLCAKTGIPVLPIFIDGTHQIAKPDSIMIRPGNVYVKIGKEISNPGHTGKDIKILMENLRNQMLELQQEIKEMKSSSEK